MTADYDPLLCILHVALHCKNLRNYSRKLQRKHSFLQSVHVRLPLVTRVKV